MPEDYWRNSLYYPKYMGRRIKFRIVKNGRRYKRWSVKMYKYGQCVDSVKCKSWKAAIENLIKRGVIT